MERDYFRLLHDVLHNGIEKDTRNGKTRAVFGRQIRHKMSEGFPLLTTKKMPFRVIATELMWFLRGDTNIKFLVDNDCNIWNGDAYKNYSNKVQPWEPHLDEKMFVDRIKRDNEFAKKWGELGLVYGAQWLRWIGYESNTKVNGLYDKYQIDQIQNLIRDLKTNPDSRRLMVTAWNPGELDHMVLPPCHYGFQVYTRELSIKERFDLWEKLPNRDVMDFPIGQLTEEQYRDVLDKIGVRRRAISLMWNQRSVDTFLGRLLVS